MKYNPKAFADWCVKQYEDKCGYIMCAIGQDPNELREWYYSGQYSGKALEKALYWKQHAPRVFDCQGMADGYLTEMTGQTVNVRARNNYAEWCSIKGTGMIPEERRVPGAAVFKRDNYVHHVGFLAEPVDADKPQGDWYVIEAKGVMYGVVKTRLLSGGWNCWGWMDKWFDYEFPEEPVWPQRRVLRRGMTGADVTSLQNDLIALGYSCGKWGADGEFGQATESAVKAFQYESQLDVDGVVGAMTWEALDVELAEYHELDKPDLVEPVHETARVTAGDYYIRTQPGAHGAVLGVAKKGSTVVLSGDQTEGWLGVIWGGEAAWVSKKAVGG